MLGRAPRHARAAPPYRLNVQNLLASHEPDPRRSARARRAGQSRQAYRAAGKKLRRHRRGLRRRRTGGRDRSRRRFPARQPPKSGPSRGPRRRARLPREAALRRRQGPGRVRRRGRRNGRLRHRHRSRRARLRCRRAGPRRAPPRPLSRRPCRGSRARRLHARPALSHSGAMRTLLRRLGTALLFLAVALCFAPSLVPPFLDRVYYRGPASGHFDGRHFFNPEDRAAPRARINPARFFNRWATGEGRAKWPERVAVRPTVPAARVEGREMRVTWIGHSTVLVQTAGLNILTDPIWSERASPFSFIGPKRVRAPGIRFEDLPRIDLVLISHNHYDHMDLPTLRRLWERDRPLIVTSLGNDTILRGEGMDAVARDWGQSVAVRPGIDVLIERNHHWGSRWGTDRNRALWSAFTVRTPAGNIFFAGDTGWGGGDWAREAARHGPFRLAIIPIGASLPRDVMQDNHVDPQESVRIFALLNPVRALGVHWGTFQLTFEAIGDPPRALAAE